MIGNLAGGDALLVGQVKGRQSLVTPIDWKLHLISKLFS